MQAAQTGPKPPPSRPDSLPAASGSSHTATWAAQTGRPDRLQAAQLGPRPPPGRPGTRRRRAARRRRGGSTTPAVGPARRPRPLRARSPRPAGMRHGRAPLRRASQSPGAIWPRAARSGRPRRRSLRAASFEAVLSAVTRVGVPPVKGRSRRHSMLCGVGSTSTATLRQMDRLGACWCHRSFGNLEYMQVSTENGLLRLVCGHTPLVVWKLTREALSAMDLVGALM